MYYECWILLIDPGPRTRDRVSIGKCRKWPKSIELGDSFLFFSFYGSNRQIDTKRTFFVFDRFHFVLFFKRRQKFPHNIFPIWQFFPRLFVFHLIFFLSSFPHGEWQTNIQCVKAHFGFVHNYEYYKWGTSRKRRGKWERWRKRKEKKTTKFEAFQSNCFFSSLLGIVSIMTAEGEKSDDCRQFKTLNIEHMQWLQVECLGLFFTSLFFCFSKSVFFFCWIFCLIFVFRCLIFKYVLYRPLQNVLYFICCYWLRPSVYSTWISFIPSNHK